MDASTEKEARDDLLTDKEKAAADAEQLNDEDVTEDVPAHPVDRGWAWMILLGAILEVFLYGGLMRSYGVFFLQFQERFGSSASQTTLIQTMLNVFVSLAGIFVMTYGMKHMTARTFICVGALLTSASYIICAYTTRIEVAIVLLGVVSGVTFAMIYLPILSYIAIYFNKHRGLANSLFTSGASVGALALGPLFNIMFEHYGYSGTMLITGGLLLNVLVTGCIFRDPSFYKKEKKKTGHRKEIETNTMQRETHNISLTDKSEEATGIGEIDTGSYNVTIKGILVNVPLESNTSTKTLPMLYRSISNPVVSTYLSGDTSSEKSEHYSLARTTPDLTRVKSDMSVSLFQSAINITTRGESDIKRVRKECGHKSSVNVLLPSTDISLGSTVALKTETFDNDCKRFCHTSSEPFRKMGSKNCLAITKSKLGEFFATVFDKSILRDPVFIHFMCFVICSAPGGFLTSMYFIPLAADVGFDSDQISILLFVIGCMDLLFKLGAGVIVDRKLLRPTTLISITFAVGCIINNLTRVISSLWQMLVFVIMQSSLGAVYLSLFAVILVELMGIEKFKGALGFTNMVGGGSMGAFFPITGAVRDVTGSYHVTYHLLSVLLMIGSVLAFTLPLTHRRNRQRQASYTKSP